MLNYLWAGMTLTGILWGALHGQMTAVTDGVSDDRCRGAQLHDFGLRRAAGDQKYRAASGRVVSRREHHGCDL